MVASEVCVGAARLAAFIEGRLDPVERRRVVRHLLGCEECSMVIAEASALAAPDDHTLGRGRRWPLWMLASAAAASIVFGVLYWRDIGPFPGRASDAGSLMRDLVVAAGDRRPTEGRLSGGFAYGPYARMRSGASASQADGRALRVSAAAGRIEARAEAEPTRDNLHALGLAHVVTGDLDAAADALERARNASRPDAELLSDLASIALERGLRQGRPDEIARALQWSDEALASDPSLATALFNRAVALEALHLRDQAIAAWTRYLEVDADSSWTQEARRRMESLKAPGRSESRPSDLEHLESAARQGNIAEVRTIVNRERRAVREWLRDEMLGGWGQRALQGDSAAPHSLAAAEAVAGVHTALSGDPLSARMVAAVRRASDAGPGAPGLTALATAHNLLALAEKDLKSLRVEDARPLLERARDEFRRADSPAAVWAEFGLAMSDYYARDYDRALTRAGRLHEEAEREGYTALSGHVHWLEGLILAVRSRLSEALGHYRLSIAAFEASGDAGYAAFVHALAAEDLRYLGDHTEEWLQRGRALELLDDAPERGVEFILMDGAIAALEQGMPLAALDLDEAVLASSRRRGDAVEIANALQWRSLARIQAAQGSEALSDLDEAERQASRALDHNVRERLTAELDYARGLAVSLQDPARARQDLGRAIERFGKSGNELRLAELYLARGRAARSAGDRKAALVDFEAGIAAFERQRPGVLDASQRITFFDTSGALFDEALDMTADSGDAQRALALAERGRTRQLLEDDRSRSTFTSADIGRLRAALPAGTSVVEYASLPRRLLIWTLSRERATMVSVPVGADEIASWTSEMRRVLRSAPDETAVRAASSRLFDLLVRPVTESLKGETTLAIVPDKALHALPFAALLDKDSGRYLVEERKISMEPSATLFSALLQSARRTGGSRPTLLAIGNPRFDRTVYPLLTALAAAEEETSRIVSGYAGSRTLMREAATKRAFLEEAPRYDIVHYAGHAIVHEGDPLRSRLILAADAEHGDDGTLFAEDLQNHRFGRTRLVVLGACATASGRISRGEGAMSFARAFLAAGVPAVIATLWDVEDRAGAELSTRLHRRLATGDSPQDALRQSQIEMIRDGDLALRSPRAWASFELIGA